MNGLPDAVFFPQFSMKEDLEVMTYIYHHSSSSICRGYDLRSIIEQH